MKKVLPPAHSSGALSIRMTCFAPACLAATAALKPALPLPATRTSHEDGRDMFGVRLWKILTANWLLGSVIDL